MLRRPELRTIVGDSLADFDGDRYHTGTFAVMPNHVHLIVGLLGDTEIQSQCTSWKRFTARRINQTLGTSGRFWQEESFDHLIRSPEQFEATERYIRDNPAHLPRDEYLLYERAVTGTFQVLSARNGPIDKGSGTRSVPTTGTRRMSFPRYPKYKDSGVEWLGEVPEHWAVMVIKWFSTLQRGHDLTDAESDRRAVSCCNFRRDLRNPRRISWHAAPVWSLVDTALQDAYSISR